MTKFLRFYLMICDAERREEEIRGVSPALGVGVFLGAEGF
jgi:hypothetical protein